MNVVRRTADFAENQTKFFITDINSKDNGARLKAIKRYKEYITTYRPEMYDDDVDFLFTGNNEHHGIRTDGLLRGCGQQSSKHEGQLKRIAGNLMSFLQWLINLECEGDIENIFFERFVRLPAAELVQMSLAKHIGLDNKSTLTGAGARGGNTVVACEILSTLLQYHVTDDGDPDPLDVDYMLNNDSASKLQFMKWLETSADDQMISAVASRPAPVPGQKAEVFADCWDDVRLRYVALQTDEAGYGGEEEMDLNEFDHAIPDPLGLSSIDLRTVVVHAHAVPKKERRLSEALFPKKRKKRMTTTSSQKMNIMKRIMTKGPKKSGSKALTHSSSRELREEEEDDSSSTHGEHAEEEMASSVIPSQKNFSSATFLSNVHGYVSLSNLVAGLKNLELRLDQQSSRREDLVRQNFGLFICCVDGLTWLKEYQGLNAPKKEENKPVRKATQGRRVSFFGSEEVEDRQDGTGAVSGGENSRGGLPEASLHLSKAKEEAQNTLAPILSRMKRSRQLKNADQILRRLASLMEYPHAMKQLMGKGDFESVLVIYQRVESLPASSNLHILKRITSKSAAIMEEMKQKLNSSLLQSQPVLPIVVRQMKLLNELESEEACRSILQKCFEKQVQCLEDHVKGITSKLNESLTAAFMKGQEFNLNNRGSDQQISASMSNRRGSYARGQQSGEFHRRRGRAMTLLSTAHHSFLQNSVTKDFTDTFDSEGHEEDRMSDLSGFGPSLTDFKTPAPPDAVFGSDKDSDAGSVSSVESGMSASVENNSQLRRILGVQFDKSFIDDDPDVDYAELLCNKVRVRDVASMVDVIRQWLPSIHKIVHMLRGYNTSQPTLTSAQKRLTSFNSNISRGRTKNAAMAYGRNQAVAGEAKRIAETLATAASFLQTAILGFTSSFPAGQKSKAANKDEGGNVYMDSIGKVFHHMFQGPMPEPHLSESVMEVSDLFDVVEDILSSHDISPGEEGSAVADMNFFGSSSYRESVLQIKSTAFEGENAVATKVLEQLLSQSLLLTSSVNKGNALAKKKVRDIDDIIRVFENNTVAHLQALLGGLRSPSWVAKVVWEYIQKILDRFISSLALMAASVESLNDKAYYEEKSIEKQLSFDRLSIGSQDESVTVEYDDVVSSARLELENLEASLLNTQHIQLAKNKSLDFVKACVRLRTNTVDKVWTETNSIFPLSVQAGPSTGPATLFRQGSTLVDMTPEKRERRRSSGIAASQNIDERISLSTGSIIVLEESAVDKYLDFILLNFRTNTHASYSVIVKNEMTSDKGNTSTHHRGLPAHISKILLDLGHIQSNLSVMLPGMSVSASEAWKDQTFYVDYLFHMICVSVVAVFTDLVDSLARNCFSLHSTGRKYQSRRLSNSSLVKDRTMSGQYEDEKGPSGDAEQELRYYSKCKYPLSCGQALEELAFFKMAVLPVLLTEKDIAHNIWIHDECNKRDIGQKFLSGDCLLREGKLFVEALRNKSSVYRKS